MDSCEVGLGDAPERHDCGGSKRREDWTLGHPRSTPLRSDEEKELHYFDREDRYRPGSHTTYHVRIPTRFELKRGSVVIDSTPFYSNSVLALDRIAAYDPGMKLIFVMREPISRAFSSWKMMHSRWPTGDEWHDKREFDEAIASNFETFGRTNPWHNYLERGVYADTIQRLWDRFPREQVLLLQSRQIAEFSEQTSRQIQEFLGIPHRDLAPIHRNVAPTQSEPISPLNAGSTRSLFSTPARTPRSPVGTAHSLVNPGQRAEGRRSSSITDG